MHKVLGVYLHGREIGSITYLGGERTLFAFHDAYLDDRVRPTLGLRFKDAQGGVITDFRPYKMRLMPFFSNLLPEGLLRHYLAETARVHESREFFLLQTLGQDLPGAVTVFAGPTRTEEDARAVSGRVAQQRTSLYADLALHFSLAGVQLKFSARQTARHGLTIPAHGVGGDWIVKLPARDFLRVPENEFSMMTLAKMVGMDVPEVALTPVAAIGNLPQGLGNPQQNALAIRRFDRKADGSAVHMEDFAQVFDVYPEDKYKKASMRDIVAVLAAESGMQDVMEMVRRMTFNVLIGNGDAHLKNWSLIYPDRRRARLAPAYDLVSTIPYIPHDAHALKFSRSKEFNDYTRAELEHFAVKSALPAKVIARVAEETVERFMACWGQEKPHLPASPDVLAAIDQHLGTLPIARPH